MTNDNENEVRIIEKIDFFMIEKIFVHIELKDRTFLNGIILKKIKNNVYWINERKLGEVFLFIKDIYDIDKYNNLKKEVTT